MRSPANTVLYLTLCMSLFAGGHTTDQGYQYSLQLDTEGQFELQWSLDYPQEIVSFQLTATVSSNDWFAIGFSDYGKVTNADLLVFWSDKDGENHLVDAYTDARGVLYPDQSQDYDVTSVSSSLTPDQQHVKLVLDFQRKFITCDPHDYELDNGTTHIIYIKGKNTGNTPLGHSVTSLSHGLQRVQLLKPELPQLTFPDDTWTFEVRAPSVHVPATSTTYWWETSLLPDMPDKHHIIKYESVVQKGNEDMVHHITVYHCIAEKGKKIPSYSGPGLGEGKPPGLAVCRHVIGAWALGALPLVYPEEAGAPIGGEGFSRYVLTEFHYNNPTRRAGVVDTSGFRFYVTKQLRQYDAGIMELGLEYTNKFAIPPGLERFSLTAYCVPECTTKGFPPMGIRVFASQLHTHLTGKRVVTRHVAYKNGQPIELPVLNKDEHYSAHFQEIRRLEPQVWVMPGDSLVTTCDFDTRSRPKATVDGFSTDDEMCVTYLHYYPKTDLELCKSSIDTESIDDFFFYMNRLEGLNVSTDIGYRASYTNMDWTPFNIDLLKDVYAESPIIMSCNASDGSRLPGNWDHMPIPALPHFTDRQNNLDC